MPPPAVRGRHRESPSLSRLERESRLQTVGEIPPVPRPGWRGRALTRTRRDARGGGGARRRGKVGIGASRPSSRPSPSGDQRVPSTRRARCAGDPRAWDRASAGASSSIRPSASRAAVLPRRLPSSSITSASSSAARSGRPAARARRSGAARLRPEPPAGREVDLRLSPLARAAPTRHAWQLELFPPPARSRPTPPSLASRSRAVDQQPLHPQRNASTSAGNTRAAPVCRRPPRTWSPPRQHRRAPVARLRSPPPPARDPRAPPGRWHWREASRHRDQRD